MARTHIRHLTLRRWFPPDDPVATAVAKLCILREDFFLELQGMTSAEIGPLDGNGSAQRRMYFWRNSLRTLEEIRHALNMLTSHATFREALSREPDVVRKSFNDLKHEMNLASDEFLRELRNAIGAHLDEDEVQSALNQMDFSRKGLIQTGDSPERIHYKFASELILAVLLKGVPDEDQLPKLEAILSKTAALITALSAMDNAISCYIGGRRLHVPGEG